MKGFSEAAAERLLFLMASDCGSSQSAFLQLMSRRQKSSTGRLLNHFFPFGRRRGRPLDGSPGPYEHLWVGCLAQGYLCGALTRLFMFLSALGLDQESGEEISEAPG